MIPLIWDRHSPYETKILQRELAPSRKIVCSWLEKAEYNFMTNAVKRVILVDLAKTSALKRLSKLTPEDMARLTGPLPTEMLDQAAVIFVGARSWLQTNDLAPKVAIPFADNFSYEKNVEFIFNEGRNGDADLIGSSGFRDFISTLYSESPIEISALDELTEKYDLEFYRPAP